MKCRFCKAILKTNFINLGKTPLSNSFIMRTNIKNKEKVFPLHAFVCNNCFLVQLDKFESPENIFSNYAYFSSYSKSWLDHIKKYVENIILDFKINKNSFVVELASNDGYLLQFFTQKKIPVLGIEPAKNVAKVAKKRKIPTLTKFFGIKTAKELTKKGKYADLIIGNNVLAHVPNLNDFVGGMKILLNKEGIITMEFPHLLKLIKKNQFDTIYHEHFSYFSLLTVEKIFTKHKLSIFDVKEIPTHGGSLRIYVKHPENKNIKIKRSVKNLIEKEKKFGMNKITTYKKFEREIGFIKQNIQKFFLNAGKKGKRIVAYGAPAKGNTLLNFCKIDKKKLEYTVDANHFKQGLFLPGSHIQIKNPNEIKKTKPDYVFILPWNLKNEIMTQHKYIKKWGGKFVIPIPKVRVIS